MKNYLISSITVCFIISSCYQEEIFSPVETDSGYIAETESFAGDTKTSLNEYNSIEWSEDDQIAVFQGSVTADVFQVIPRSVGKTTGTFCEVSEYGDDYGSGSGVETNVAIYPYTEGLVCSKSPTSEEGDVPSYRIANVVMPSVQTWQASSFPDNAFVMAAVTDGLSDKKLKFRNVSGALRLRISGEAVIKTITVKGNSGELISGPADIYAYADDSVEPTVSMRLSANEEVILDCGSGVSLKQDIPTEFIIALPPTVFEKGFTITIADANGKKDTRTTGRTSAIRRSRILNMPEIIYGEGELSLEECTDIAVNETANSYIVSKSGSYSFPAVKGNGSISVGTVASVDVLWETFGTDEVIHKGDLIRSVAFDSGKILFRTASRFREGNAVIAAKNSSGTILWSWHIWLTDKPSEHVYKNGAGTMMDRNLGATSATPGDVGTLGLQYQWGRKDPFLSYADIHERSAVVSTIKWPSSVRTSPETGTVGYSIANPTTIIHDWDNYDDWLTSPNHSLWDDDKTIYDPCPAGWRVPDGGPQGVWKRAGFSGTEKFDNTNKGVNFSIEQPSSTWYPIMPPYSGSSYQIHSASYWSVDVLDNESYQFYMAYDEDGFRIYNWNMQRNYNGYVRCYKEDSANTQIDYIDEYGVNHGKGTEIDGVVWAPVNCGYLKSLSYLLGYPYGKLYQWGRKYGQGYSTQYDESEGIIKDGPVSLITGQSESNQKYVFKNISSPWDWLSSPDGTLWNSGTEDAPKKTSYDPCPAGWRVPTRKELCGLVANSSSWTSNSDGQNGYWVTGSKAYSSSAPKVFLPAAGNRRRDSQATTRTSYGYYWSSGSLDVGAYDIFFSKNGITEDDNSRRVSGYSVRCVQE